MITFERVTVIKVRKPINNSLNDELQWLGTSLGLFNLRDKDKSCFRVFLELLKSGKQNKGMTSDELAKKLALSRGTVVHHLSKLMEQGIVIHEGNLYYLRGNSLSDLIEEIEGDFKRISEDLKTVAKRIDRIVS